MIKILNYKNSLSLKNFLNTSKNVENESSLNMAILNAGFSQNKEFYGGIKDFYKFH